MHNKDRVLELIHKYLDKTATEDEIAELDRLLAENPDVAAEFAKAAQHENDLYEYFREKQTIDLGDRIYSDLGRAKRIKRLSKRTRRAARTGHWRWIAAAVAAVLLVVLAFAFFPRSSETTDVAEEETPFTMPAEDKPTIEKKDTAPTPVPSKKLVEERPAPAEKKSTELAKVPAPPVEKESPAPDQPEKKPPFAEKPEQPEKPVPPVREKPKTELVEKEQQEPAPFSLAITVDDELKSKGKLQVRKGKRWQTVEAGKGTFLWQANEQIRTTRLARFTTADGTRVLLSKATLVLSSVQPVTLGLERGEIFCEVAPGEKKDEKIGTPETEPGGKTIFIVRTKEAEVRATTTQFGVKYASGRTTVMVTEGEVILANTKGEVTVPAGMTSSAVKTSAPKKPKRVKEGKYFGWRYQLASPVVWRRDFDKKELIDGKCVLLDEPGGKVSAAESRPSTRKSGPDPEVKIGLYAPSKEQGGTGYFFKIPENFEMRLRIKSEKPGTIDLYIQLRPDKPDGKVENFLADGIRAEPEWKEIVLRGKDFKPEKNTRPFQAGMCINSVHLFGLGTGTLHMDRIVVKGERRK